MDMHHAQEGNVYLDSRALGLKKIPFYFLKRFNH